jgi:hypothetical protein
MKVKLLLFISFNYSFKAIPVKVVVTNSMSLKIHEKLVWLSYLGNYLN